MATRTKRKGTTIDDVRAIALSLPETDERPSYGTPGFRVKNKLFARDREDGTVVIRVTFDVREALVASAPHVFEVTPHYASYPWVLVHLANVDRAWLRELLVEAWKTAAPPRVAAKLV